MNKNIIIAIVVIVIIAVGAVVFFGQVGKQDTQIKIINNETFQNGEQVKFELKDSNGAAISGQNVSIIYNKNETYSVVTDSNGKGSLLISGESAGKYEIEVKYNGNDKYKGCSAKETITITDDAADNPASQTGSSVASTNKYNNDPVSKDNGQERNSTPDNPFPGDEGTYYIAKYGLWVRSSDQVVIDTNHGSEAIGLTLNEWLLRYAPVTPPVNGTEG